MQYLTFRLNSVEYAVEVTAIETVLELGPIMAVPSPIDYLKGVMDLRGKAVPVIDLRKKLGLPGTDAVRGASIIVISVDEGDSGSISVGALVDEVEEVVTLEEAGILAAREEGNSLWEDYVRGIVRCDGRMVIVISVDGLFSMREIEGLRDP
jgi:purine-binding chemotaxis protein CheW